MVFSHDVLVAHAGTDHREARSIAEALRSRGLKVWFGEWERTAREGLDETIRRGVEHSRALALCISGRSVGREWARLERYTFPFRDPAHRDRSFVAIHLDEVPITHPIGQPPIIDWTQDQVAAADQIALLCRPAGTGQPVASTPVPTRQISMGTTADMHSATTSPADGRVWIGFGDGIIRSWDPATGTLPHALVGHRGTVTSLAFSPDGSRLASGSSDRTSRIWDLTTSGTTLHLRGHIDRVAHVTFAPDGSTLATASVDGTVRIWDAGDGHLLHQLDVFAPGARASTFSRDARRVAAISDDGICRIYSVADGTLLAEFQAHTQWSRAIQFSPEGTYLATGSDDGSVRLWDAESYQAQGTLRFPDGAWVRRLDFATGDDRIIAGATNGVVALWETSTAEPIWTERLAPSGIIAITTSPIAESATIASRTQLKRIDLRQGESSDTLATWLAGVRALRLHDDPSTAVTLSDDQMRLQVWDTKTGTRSASLRSDARVGGMCMRTGADEVLLGDANGVVTIWRWAAKQDLMRRRGPRVRITAIDGIAALPEIVMGDEHGNVRLMEIESGKIVSLATLTGPVTLLRLVPGSSQIVAGSEGGHLVLIDKDQRTVRTLTGHRTRRTDRITDAAVASSALQVATASTDGTVRVWDLDLGIETLVLEGHTGRVTTVAFSPDETRLVSGSTDRSVRVWDIATGDLLSLFQLPQSGVRAAAFEADDSIVVVSTDNVVRAWQVDPRQGAHSSQSVYTNAKVVLIGESQAGKTGLAMRIARDEWAPSESTLGAWATQFTVRADPEGQPSDHVVEREIWLWDFGGQADQRLVHQLYLGDAAVAVLVFDGQRAEMFDLWDWTRAIATASPDAQRLLAAGRIDHYPVRINTGQLQQFCAAGGYTTYIPTSARTAAGCAELRTAIVTAVDWSRVPHRSSPHVFTRLRRAILDLRDRGRTLTTVKELRDWLPLSVGPFDAEQLDAVLGLLAGPGAVLTLGFGDYVLLQPGLLNSYAQAVIRTLRQDPQERGAVAEERVLSGNDLDYPPGFERLPEADERIILHAMHKQLVASAICMRLTDGGTETPTTLLFPSFFRRERPPAPEMPVPYLSYSVSGPLDEVYSSLVVRLHHGQPFENTSLWQDVAEFSATEGSVAISLVKAGDGTGELRLHAMGAGEAELALLGRYTRDHVRRHAAEVTEFRTYICPSCGTPVENREAVRKRLLDNKPDVGCVLCEARIPLRDAIARQLESSDVRAQVEAMRESAQVILDNESKERVLVGEVIATVAQAGQISRELTVSDHGIDMEVEFKDESGHATGARVYLQLKSGRSHLRQRESDGSWVFRIRKSRHADYWADQPFPVMLVIRDDDGTITWMDVRQELRRLRERGEKWPPTQIGYTAEPFDLTSLAALRERIFDADPPLLEPDR